MAKEGIYRSRAKIAKSLAHPVRLQIVDMLADEGEKTVTELTRALDVSQSTVSKHMKTMYDAGLLTFEKHGLRVFYGIRTPCIADLFRCLDAILHEDLDFRRKQIKEGGKNDHG